MRRREFITLLSGAAAWPLAARAQKPMPVAGFLCAESPALDATRVKSVHKGLQQAGYVDGRNLTIEYRYAEGHYDRLTALATDLANLPVSVIVAIGTTPAAVAAKAATTVVPIIFIIGTDPVKLGLVASLDRPGSNLTGVSFLNRVIVSKQFEILHEIVPKATVSSFLVNPSNPFVDFEVSDAQMAANALGLKLLVVKVTTENEIETAFTTLNRQGAGSLVVAGDLLLNSQRHQIIALAARHTMPVIYLWREATVAGGLVRVGIAQ